MSAKRDGLAGERVDGAVRVTLATDAPGVVKTPHPTAPGYVEISLSAEEFQQMAGEPVESPRSTGGIRRYALSGPIRHNLVRQRREESGRSVAELAAAAHLPETILVGIEEDTETVTDRDQRMISAALGHGGDLDFAFPWEVGQIKPTTPAPFSGRSRPAPKGPPPTPAALAADVVAAEAEKQDGIRQELGSIRERLRRLGRS